MASYTRSITVEWHGLRELRRMLGPELAEAGLQKGMNDVAHDVAGRAKRHVPVKTARLARSIRVFGQMSGPTRRIVAGNSHVRYAAAVHEGTGLWGPKHAKYPIKPKNKKALFFATQNITSARFGKRAKLHFRKSGKLSNRSIARYGNAAFVVTKLVMHPGMRGRPYMERALNESPIAKILGNALHDAWKRAQ